MEQLFSSKVITERNTFSMTTTEIEDILRQHLRLKGEVSFDWNIGNWVSLDISQTIVTEL